MQRNGVDSVLVGACNQGGQRFDAAIADDARNKLFLDEREKVTTADGPRQPVGDLACRNILRGRDHGVASYNDVRKAYGLTPARTWEDVTSNVELAKRLRLIYGTQPDDGFDAWTGVQAEDVPTGPGRGVVGPLAAVIIKEQFEASRHGDRFWWQNDPALRSYLPEIKALTLADVIARHTGTSPPPNGSVFHLP